MQYYEVYVASQRYHGQSALTYAADFVLGPGAVVTVPLQRDTVLAMVVKQVPKPSFACKPVTANLELTLPVANVRLLEWLANYYPGPLGILAQLFMPGSLKQAPRTKQNEQAPPPHLDLPPLTADQEQALAALRDTTKPALLHGITGSGKTRVYIELAQAELLAGRSSLILTPEIGLTPQLFQSLTNTFGDRVVTVHSELTPAQRRDVWLKICNTTQPIIVIGPRSALFSPIHNLGLIVMDEAHDNAYKQEQAPYYQTSRVAATLAGLHKAKLVMGSATPLLDDYYTFEAKGLPIITMEHLARDKDAAPVAVEMINLRDRAAFSRSAWLSTKLLEAITLAISRGEQALVFLNRRGTARLVICQICGWQAVCPRCDLPLTYHGDSHHLQCHTCGYTQSAPTSCPMCSSADISFKSIGTKSLVAELERLFPKARVQRFDSDNLKAERMEAVYQSVSDGSVDILVGTQVLTKGLDLPKLSVVGVVLADTSMYFPDYTAEERTFQMLTQVLGRVGRGHRAGTVIIQSYNPDNPTIQQAVAKDYRSFYEAQIKERQLFHFPPFYFVLKLRIGRKRQSSTEQAAHKFAQELLQQRLPIELSGPSPAFIEKINDVYYWQIIIKAKQRKVLLDIISQLPANWTYDIDPTNLL